MKKRFLAILLTICMVLSMAPAALAAETDPFTDVNSADWYYDEVQYVYENDLMKGTSDTTFSPDTTVSRAMIVTILYRLEGQPTVSTAGTFTDVAAGQYYTEAVEWGYANQIIGGYGSGLFGPSDPLTREQMAAILYRYAQYKEYDVSDSADLSGYTDVGTVSAYALDAFAWANANGLVKGTSATTLSPKGSATRAQFAVILYRFCVNVVADADAAEEYTVTFEYNYGSKGTYKTVKVKDGETVDKPTNPTRSGYSFSSWYTKASGGSKFDFDTAITDDLTLYARWSSNGGGGGGSHSHRYSDEWSHDADKHWNAATCGHDVKKNEAAHTTDADGLCSVCGVYVASTNEQLEKAVHSVGEDIVIYLKGNLSVDVAPWETKAMGGVSTKTITIDGGGHTLTLNQTDSDWNHVTTNGAKLILKNMDITNSGYNNGPWNRHDINFDCEVELENVNSDKALAFKAGVSLTNVAISDANDSDTYAIWIQPNGQTVTLNGCTIDMLECTDGRGIKIDDQYVTAQKVTLNVSDTIFKTEEKSAIIVKSPAGADITLSNVDITNVAADSTNAVWVDEDSAASYNLVTVIGGTKILENHADAVAVAGATVYESLQAALNAAGVAGAGNTTISIIKDIELTDAWAPVEVDGYNGAGIVMIEGGGHTITGLDAPLFAGGFAGNSGIVIKDLTLDKANMTDISNGATGFGAFISSIDSMPTIELKNCKLTNSTITSTTGSRVGGLIGWTAGYDIQDNGPVDTKVTIQNCEVSNCIITAKGSVGTIIGHAGCNSATYHNISDCVVKNNTLTSYDDSYRVGVVVGTAQVGEVTISGITESGNTLKQMNGETEIARPESQSALYGRFVPGTTGKLTIDGVTMLANGVSYGHDADKNIYSVSDNTSLDYVIGNMKATNITLAAGTYTMPASAKGKTLTISGTKDTTINVVKAGEGDYGLDGSTVTFEGLALSFNEQDFNGYVRAKATYNNCTIEGRITLYGESIFNNCTFNNMEGYNVWTWGSNATFNNCTFNCGGKAVLVYGGSTSTVNITNCTFNDNGGFNGKAAIETGSDYGEKFNINIENVTVNGFDVNTAGISTGTNVWANKSSIGADRLNVVINGVDVY